MADAFRIAFEQQLMRTNDQALRLAHGDKWRRAATWINRQHLKEDGNWGSGGWVRRSEGEWGGEEGRGVGEGEWGGLAALGYSQSQ